MSHPTRFGSVLSESYPNHLLDVAPSRLVPRRRLMLLGVLLITAFLPRVWMAIRSETICPDGTFYIELAQALERGDMGVALHEMHLNTYPVILVIGHQLGLDWEFTGKWWGVLAATLVVWPLFNWVRRQFDDVVAITSCLIYAMHPKLIEWSGELIRDPTFWLLLALSLDWLWRAMVEVRLRWFLLAGASMTLAVLTRFEGLFLLFPLTMWGVVRWMALREQRGRLALGAVICTIAFPVLLIVVNLWLLRDDPHFEAFRSEPLDRVGQWLASLGGSTAQAVPGMLPLAVPRIAMESLPLLFVNTMLRGLTPAFSLVFIVGYLAFRPTWDRRDHVPLALFAIAVAIGVWIHLWFAHQGSSRYALSIVLISTRCAALGLLFVARESAIAVGRHQWNRRLVRLIPLGVVLLFFGIGFVEAMHHHDDSRLARAELGKWINQHYGSQAVVLCTDDMTYLIAYYHYGQARLVVTGTDPATLVAAIARMQPRIVALSRDRLPAEAVTAVLMRRRQLHLSEPKWDKGYRPPKNMLVLTQSRVEHQAEHHHKRLTE